MKATTYLTSCEGIDYIRDVASSILYGRDKDKFATTTAMLAALADIEATICTVREVIAYDSDHAQPVQFGREQLTS